jgi:WD40 repeat protein
MEHGAESIVFTHHDSVLIAAGQYGQVGCWNLHTGAGQATRMLPEGGPACGPYISPDGNMVLGPRYFSWVSFWDVESLRETGTIERLRSNPYELLEYVAGGSMLAMLVDEEIELWDTRTCQLSARVSLREQRP